MDGAGRVEGGMRICTAAVCLFLISATLPGCKPDAPRGVEKEAGKSSADPKAPVKGGTYILAYGSQGDAWSLGPIFSGSGREAIIYQFVYNTLAEMNGDLSAFMPALAERWEVSEDGLAVTFHLRRDVRWQDGHPFTAEDVVFSVRAWLLVEDAYLEEPLLALLKGAREYRKGASEALPAVEALDRYTVRFHFAEPNPLFMYKLNRRPMVPKHLLEGKIKRGMTLAEVGELDFAKHPVGTGPFRVVDYDEDQYIEFEKNPDYFRGEPYLDRIVIRLLSSEIPVATGLETGEIHSSVIWNKEHYPRLFSLDQIRVWEDPAAFGSFSLIPNLRAERKGHPLHDARFRKAILYAIPRKKICDHLRMVSHPAPNQAYSPRFLEGLPLTGYSYNPEKARALLAEMGYDSETAPELVLGHLIFDKSPEQPAMQQALAEVGIKVKLLALETAGVKSLVANAEGWDLIQCYFSQHPDPGVMISTVIQCPGPPWELCGWGAMFTWKPTSRYVEIEKLQRGELDVEVRKTLLQEAIVILDEEMPTLPLWTESNVYFISKRIHGAHQGIYKYGSQAHVYIGAETWWLEAKR